MQHIDIAYLLLMVYASRFTLELQRGCLEVLDLGNVPRLLGMTAAAVALASIHFKRVVCKQCSSVSYNSNLYSGWQALSNMFHISVQQVAAQLES